jgi:hypothetical protein
LDIWHLTEREREIIRGLAPHARLHAVALLAGVDGLRPTSGRRTPQRNRAVGGVASSFHLTGRAIDLAGSSSAIAAGRRAALAQRVTPGCLGPEEALDEGDHLHVAW